MKKLTLLALSAFLLFSESKANDNDSTTQVYTRLVAGSDEDKQQLEKLLLASLKSNEEKDWVTARNFFSQLKKRKVVDSIATLEKKKFPLGQLMRNEEVTTVYNEKDAVKKEKLYEAWIKKFAPKSGEDVIVYDYARNAVATAYANAGNVQKALEYADKTESDFWKGEGWASVAGRLKEKGFINEAEALYKKAQALSLSYKKKASSDPKERFAASGYFGYSSSIAQLYVEQKRYQDAYPYIKEVYDSAKRVNPVTNATYAEVLKQMGKKDEALKVLEAAVKDGKASDQVKNNLKELYTEIKGGGYDTYIAEVNAVLATKVKEEMKKQMINKPAPRFTVKDVDGKTVSLDDYKGKTLVLDFWATWCGPCIQSFPAMNKAVSRFKDDPNVKFFFIHTWEREEHATDSARAFMTKNNYPFHVLMDLKNAEGVNEVVSKFDVPGIPTKFIVDGNGNIRFKFVGGGVGYDAAVEEVVAMVQLAAEGAKKPD
jgi:peroxiredoxin/uncharacterized protein (UPF0335 family)